MIRIGQGIDVHQFVKGRKLILGGCDIPHSHGLDGHSDADVLTHAVMDALLGAAGERDIGVLFPNTDAAYKGADSLKLLDHVRRILEDKKAVIQNLDCTVLAEAPKLSPHIPLMKQRLAETLKISSDQVSIKATTTEKMGFSGRGEGMLAFAVVLLEIP
jgi:2-C-methyl-D-erythritol 2,4-cyclodiphosphate synthase